MGTWPKWVYVISPVMGGIYRRVSCAFNMPPTYVKHCCRITCRVITVLLLVITVMHVRFNAVSLLIALQIASRLKPLTAHAPHRERFHFPMCGNFNPLEYQMSSRSAVTAKVAVVLPRSVSRPVVVAFKKYRTAAEAFRTALLKAWNDAPRGMEVEDFKTQINQRIYDSMKIKTTQTGKGHIVKVQLSQAHKAIGLGSGSPKPTNSKSRPESLADSILKLSARERGTVYNYLLISTL